MTKLLDIKDKVIGYHITEKIYSGSKTLVYRGIREKDRQSVILKLMATEYPTFSEITQFRNQYTIAKSLDLPGIVKPLSIENYRNGYALVMEDFGGISLADWQLQDQGMENNAISLSQFFPIAIEIVSILEGLHRYRVIHKDIKPANILINPSTGEVKIIDFSLATLLPREIQFLTNPNVLEGTLAYISPEQTGRMNRGIDYRSDFYSLGVTFFELLTGQLPFTATDPIELVYSHIAKRPLKASDINANIPPVLSDIVTKLMAKNAEDRYQSTHGLKYDLSMCRDQWQTVNKTGNIGAFELGVRDVSDRFLIPEKLYGRQHEVETLLAAFERVTGGTTEMMLVAGFSGIGKTAVVNEVHKPIARQRSYFIKGKFDQFQRDIPLSALVQALRDLIGQLLSETDTQIQHWKTKILSALGEQAAVITDILPELEQIIGKQPEISELSGSAAQNRFNLLFQRFIQVFTTKEHPLVIFIDDLQWADAASLKLIELLMSQTNETARGLLLIGAYRDNEVSKAHPLYLTIQEIEKAGATINHITLKPLNQSELNNLIADTLRCEETLAVPLTQIVFARTNGNPFFATQLLTSLYQDGIIRFSFDVGSWQYDIAEVQAIALTDDVVEFMAIQLKKLPELTQQVLMLAACIGNEFDLQTLATVYKKSVVDTASDIWKALQEGLVVPQTNIYKLFQHGDGQKDSFESKDSKELSARNLQTPKYKFIHDRVQQAAYSLIPEDQQKAIHLEIGLLLLNNTPVAEREENIFQIVNHCNIAVELIADQTKYDELAQMNLLAGRKALASTAYPAALRYLTTGIELLTPDSWVQEYDLSLALYETAAEAAYLAGEFEQMEGFVEVVLAQAKTLLEKVKVHEVKIQAYGAQNKALEAVNIALAFLKLLGVEFPENPSQSDMQLAMAEVASNMNGRHIEDLINLPKMIHADKLAMMRILSSINPFTYQAVPELFSLNVLKQINLSLRYGNAPLSALAYVTYGLILNAVVGDIESGYQFGKLAINLLREFQMKEVDVKVIATFNPYIRSWKEHTKEVLKPVLEAYSTGLETGNLEYASYCLYTYCYASYFIGRELIELKLTMASYSSAISQMNQERAFHWNSIYRQLVCNLLGDVEDPCRLIGEAYDEDKMLPLLFEGKDRVGLLYLNFSKLHLCYLFQDFSQAVEHATQAEKYLDGGIGNIVVPLIYFYESLARLALYPDASQTQQNYILNKILTNQEKIQKWADYAPMNYLHKYYLVEAEKHRVIGKFFEAIELYDRAISLAKENEYINEEALANELAANFYLELGKQNIAQTYLTNAYYCYSRWGAKAKVTDLANRYTQLLAPILEQEKLSPHPSHKTTSNSKSLSTLSNHHTIIGSKTSISDSLDLAALLRVSQALSGEIELEQLVSTLIKVVIENACASKCALILSKGNNSNLTIAAVSSSSTTKFPSISLELSDDVPITLVNYVKRTLQILVIDDAKTDTFLVNDRYIIHQQPCSLLCIPIINQGKLLGIFYLENNLTTGAFTNNRLEVLQLLTTQAAISLENAILYRNLAEANEKLIGYNHTLEEMVEKRTQELNDKNQSLQQTLRDLQRTQSQLIQSEKMSSLGQMVAGIAHEINNPINFIHGNIQYTSRYVQDLLNLINIYQQEYPNPSPILKEQVEEIDINFILQDLPKILDSMNMGTSRIRNIVLGLRNFSRLDESEMKPIDIHEGIDNTLMILQHRLKKQSERSEITVIKKYEQLPKVNCYAGQLNQAFMNILSNAIDALEEGMRTKKWGIENSQPQTPIIRICTKLVNNRTVRILIADNGCGMTEAVQQKIFDPFFTTKPVGGGTGLGLSISYQVVVDKHKGQLICNSTPGAGTEFVIEIPVQ
ncbi:serine/threonine protein kinase [Dulcicalothrix desertica PCC 7102]|uniref:histidine kinase n=1 Tax=Dulcicalothrix desertica PCC 7102 TaxID=232991 RepID=A0A433VIX7_9CYAN|nr:ATP-binding sensor histidine kinase [Dulcicalothrix desertica]RUT06068.1 serine/threonine protein kinase [Dulcicalothrix desertica PCC 7102]TWH54268.1 putative ATPase [Dulcicalothrix desertica PCC 7102]